MVPAARWLWRSCVAQASTPTRYFSVNEPSDWRRVHAIPGRLQAAAAWRTGGHSTVATRWPPHPESPTQRGVRAQKAALFINWRGGSDDQDHGPDYCPGR